MVCFLYSNFLGCIFQLTTWYRFKSILIFLHTIPFTLLAAQQLLDVVAELQSRMGLLADRPRIEVLRNDVIPHQGDATRILPLSRTQYPVQHSVRQLRLQAHAILASARRILDRSEHQQLRHFGDIFAQSFHCHPGYRNRWRSDHSSSKSGRNCKIVGIGRRACRYPPGRLVSDSGYAVCSHFRGKVPRDETDSLLTMSRK